MDDAILQRIGEAVVIVGIVLVLVAWIFRAITPDQLWEEE